MQSAPARPVAHYVYRRADGSEYGTKTRFEPGFHGDPKSFLWSRPVPEEIRELCRIPGGHRAIIDGRKAMHEGWFVPELCGDGTTRFRQHKEGKDARGAVLIPDPGPPPLFRLPELIATPPDGPGCVITESEKDVGTLVAAGFVATCPPNGSNTWLPEYATYFHGRSVLLCPHNDAPGRGLMECVAGTLFMAGVRELRILSSGSVEGYALGEREDVTDWALGQCEDIPTRRRRLRQLIAKLPAFQLTHPKG